MTTGNDITRQHWQQVLDFGCLPESQSIASIQPVQAASGAAFDVIP